MTQLMVHLLTQLNINMKDVYLFGHVDLLDVNGKCFGIVLLKNGHLITKFWARK